MDSTASFSLTARFCYMVLYELKELSHRHKLFTMERETIYPNRPLTGGSDLIKRISWSAVFAGVLVAIVTQMLLTLLGLGIGLGTIDPFRNVIQPLGWASVAPSGTLSAACFRCS